MSFILPKFHNHVFYINFALIDILSLQKIKVTLVIIILPTKKKPNAIFNYIAEFY